MNLIIWHLRDNLLSDDLAKIDAALRDADAVDHPYLAKPKPPKPVQVMPGETLTVPFQRYKLADVKPPPGWKSDEENWAGIQAFMGSRPG